ncbi:retention module-containing protein, partial [Halomonas campaniensis]
MTIATVTAITGQAWARDADGNLRELRVGDTLQEGEVLVTSDNGRVELDFGDALDPTVIEGGQQVAMTPELDPEQAVDAEEASALDEDLEALLTAIDEGEGDLLADLDATAAGAGPGGAADGGHSFVSLARITEDVNPLAFNFGMGQLGAGEFPEDEPALLAVAEEEEDFGVSISGLTLDGADLTVDEANLANGSNPDAGALVQTGSFTVSAPDGIATLSVGGAFIVQDGVLQSLPIITTEAGNVLAITGYTDNGDGTYTVEYSYTLNGAKDHSAPGDDSSLDQVFAVTLVDTDGDSATANLTIAVLDDAPSAEDVSGGTVTEDAAENVLNGNVLDNDIFGADGPDEVTETVTWNVTDEQRSELEQYGSLELNDNGSWSFTLDNSLAAVQALGDDDSLGFSLAYTITDADGDTSSATLSLTIQGVDDSAQVIVNAEGADSVVDEAGLPGGTQEDEDIDRAEGSFQVSATDTIASVSVGGETFTLTELETFSSDEPSAGIDTVKGTLYLTGYNSTDGNQSATISYLYVLDEAQTHGEPATETDEVLVDSVDLAVTGLGGSTATGTLSIDVLDDAPDAEPNANTVDEGAVLDVSAEDGVLKNDQIGADGPSNGWITGVAFGDQGEDVSGDVGVA